MRHFFNFLATAGTAVLISTASLADTISPQEASGNIGRHTEVAGVVSQVTQTSGGTTFINFGGRFPNHAFYAVIFKKNASAFRNLNNLEGKSVGVAGTIELYKGKPQIIVTSPDQIKQR